MAKKTATLMDVKNFFTVADFPVTAKEMKELDSKDKTELKELLVKELVAAEMK